MSEHLTLLTALPRHQEREFRERWNNLHHTDSPGDADAAIEGFRVTMLLEADDSPELEFPQSIRTSQMTTGRRFIPAQ